jgi:hypothetical protein
LCRYYSCLRGPQFIWRLALDDVCEQAGVAFVSVVEPLLASRVWMSQVAAGDGAHPATEGYEVLSDLVIAAGWADWLRGA